MPDKKDKLPNDERLGRLLARFIMTVDEEHITKDQVLEHFKTQKEYFEGREKDAAAALAQFVESWQSKQDTAHEEARVSIEQQKEVLNSAATELFKQAVKQIADKLEEVDMRMSEVRDGKDADNELIASLLLDSMVEPVLSHLQNMLPKLGERIRDGLELLPEGEKLSPGAIEGLEATLEDLRSTSASSQPGQRSTGGGGGRPIMIKGLGVTIDKNVRILNFKGSGLTSVVRNRNGIVDVTIGGSSSGTQVSEEVPTNSGDDTNFTIAHTPISGTFRLYRGGARQASIGATPDYTLTGTALVLTTPLDTANGEVLFADYSYE